MTTKKIATYALVASVYTVLSLVVAPFSFGQIQVRLGEMLMLLCLLDKEYVYALTLGCFLTNLIGIITGMNPMILDIIVGTAATFIAGTLVYKFRNILTFKKPLFSISWVAIVNGVLVGLELAYYFKFGTIETLLTMIYVAVGEMIACGVGLIVYEPMKRLFSDAFK